MNDSTGAFTRKKGEGVQKECCVDFQYLEPKKLVDERWKED
jgi:hypothetical protein